MKYYRVKSEFDNYKMSKDYDIFVGNELFTKKELETIKSVENIREEKILFVLLCMAKQQAVSIGFTDGLFMYSITDLYKMARISVPADDREYILHDILIKGFISCPKKNDTKCLKVNFIDTDGEQELFLSEIDCQELAYVYLKWKDGKGFKRCKSCGRLMKSKGNKDICTYCEQSSSDNKHIWCIDCGEEVEISPFDAKTCRCDRCQHENNKKNKREYWQKSFLN